MNTTPDHPDFTALALGEHILGAPSRMVTEALRTSVAARNEAEQIRLTARQLSMVLRGQPVARLDASRRNAIFNADAGAVRARFAAEEAAASASAPVLLPNPVVVRRRSWLIPAAAAAVLVAGTVAAFTLFPAQPSPSDGAVAKQQATPPDNKVSIKIAAPGVSAQPRAQVPPAVKSPAPSLTQIPLPPLKSAPGAAPVNPPAIVQQPGPRLDPAPEMAPPPPALKGPLPDFATPEKRRQK